ncbi:MAG: class II aldolase/adducin family protein [Oscillospiraceae bacterium]|nr:class II aldolase/adducin family protein [Oscillospiraceae bacterium]
MSLNELRQQVLRYYSRAYEDGLMSGTSGNASAFDRASGRMVITPSGVDYRKMTPGDLAVTGLDGKVMEGEMPPSSEWRLHAAIYRECPEAAAVLHTHSCYATAFSVVGKEIPEILIEMSVFTDGAIPVSPFAPAGSEEVALMTAATLKNRHTCLMQNHGVAAWGASMEDAYVRAVYVEDAAKICSYAMAVGTPRTIGEAAAARRL